MRLVAVDASAASLGLAPGLALADARARVPRIAVREHEPERDRALLGTIAEWCDRYTPVVIEEPPDGLLLEVSGSAHLFGGEAILAGDLAARLHDKGFALRWAVATTAAAARAVSRFGKPAVIAGDELRQTVSALPVAALELDADKALALRRAGLARIADLAALPRKPLAARFGQSMVERLSAVLGEIDPPATPRRPLPEFFVECRFAEPIGLEEDVTNALGALARDLCARLDTAVRGGRVFEASFFRADGATRRIRALSGRPLRDPNALSRLFAMRLDALADPLDPGFGFDMIRLAALADEEARPLQAELDGRVSGDIALADLVDRLTARFGADAVERFEALESHLPERAVRLRPAIAAGARHDDWPVPAPDQPPTRPILIFNPPQPVETMAEVPEGPPFRFRWRRVLHEIARAEGPERIAAEWWRDPDARSRDYYRVEDRQGRRFWLFREGIYGRETDRPAWFIHGLFA